MKMSEIVREAKLQTPEQARIKALQQRVKQAQAALATERQRQQTLKHQERLRTLAKM